MLKKMCIAALLCGAMAAPGLAQKTRWSMGFSLANAPVSHPFENPPQPGSSSGVGGVYGGILEKDYGISNYAVEAVVQYSTQKGGSMRLRGGYSLRKTSFTSVYATSTGEPANKNTTRETTRGWHFAPGFVASHSLGKFTLNAGAEIPVHFFSRLESLHSSTSLDAPENNTSEFRRYFPGGFAMGAGPLAGFSFQPNSHWSIGVEARTAWLYTQIKGNYREQNSWSGLQTQKGTAETYRSGGLSNVQIALQLRFML